jgi:uncharacterized repeat protein (TIGR03803 family)
MNSSVLHDFKGGPKDGATPVGQLMQASDGNYYGTTYAGGRTGTGSILVPGLGSLFQLTPAGVYTQLYSFTGGNDGAQPYAGLIEAADGNLYGLTSVYGQYGSEFLGGTLFQFNLTTKKLVTLYSFQQGGGPIGDLIDDGNGTLYGTTISDGDQGLGSVWSWNYETGAFRTLYSFTGNLDGASPIGGLVLASDGRLYGTARYGGFYNNNPSGYGDGTVFTLNTDGTDFHSVYSFSNGAVAEDGWDPAQDLAEGPDGNLYGTTANGGFMDEAGSLFQVIPTGATSKVNTLATLGQDAFYEAGNVFLGRPLIGGDGLMYIVGSIGGYENAGQVLQFDYKGHLLNTVYSFEQPNDDYAIEPDGGVIETADGSLYGTASASPFSEGVMYALPTQLPPVMTLAASESNAFVGIPFSLNWSVTNAFSRSASVCMARSTDGTFGGNGSIGLRNVVGTETITPVKATTVTYALTCGGVETATTSVVVSKIASTATITSAPSSVLYGKGITYKVTVTGQQGSATPTGSVTLTNGAQSLGTLRLVNGSATITVSSSHLVPAAYGLQIAYSGDGTFLPSISAPSPLTVQKVTPTITFTATPPRITQGTTTNFAFAVSNGGVTVPTGSVKLSHSGQKMDIVPLTVGAATFTFDSTPDYAGALTIQALYQGDAYNEPATVTETIQLATAITETTLSGPSSFTTGSPATFNITVGRLNLPETPTRTVNLLFNGKAVGTGTLANGTTSITLPAGTLAAGSYAVKAYYLGDANNNASMSTSMTVQVTNGN